MSLIVTEQAKADIEGIIEYTIERFGIEKAFKYDELITETLDTIAVNPFSPLHKQLEKPDSAMYFLRAGKHNVYYELRAGNTYIVRILHQQMNQDLHL